MMELENATLVHCAMNRNIDPTKRNEQILLDLLKIESNKYCADCGQKGTRWASWNIGVFLCIRCGGLHRSLGTHISKVKSVTLDKWTDEQIESIKSKGNAKVNMLYNPHPDKHPFPTFSGDMENFIRDKYERKLFMVDSGSNSLGPMSLKSSGERSKNNIMDAEIPFESRSTGSNVFKTSSYEASDSNYSKQIALLSEMGFTDTEFNYKTLKAANGNMQEALEILVAANQKQRRKTNDRNIFDEFEEMKISDPVPQSTSTKIVNSNDQEQYKSPPPMNLDDWSFNPQPKKEEPKVETKELDSQVLADEKKSTLSVDQKSTKTSNPWDNEDIDESLKDNDSKNKEDPFDTYKAFRSTPDTYFDNPW